MDAFGTETFLAERKILWALAAFIGLIALTTNLPWQLDDYDQAKQAFTSFEMVKEGHWFYQRTPHERVATKPPLVGWISAALYEVTRCWPLAWRLPSLGATAALAFLLYQAAATYGSAAALMAVAAFGLNLLTPRLATLVRTDMPLALVVFAVGIMIWRRLRLQIPWTDADRLTFFLVLSAAMLIKGPIIYAFVLPGIVVFEWWRRRNQSTGAWPGWWPWLASLGLFLIWVGCGSRFVPGFYDQVVVREFLGRFGETIHRPQPIYFYLPHLLHKFAPWSMLMIGLAIFEAVNRRKFDRLNQATSDENMSAGRPKITPETMWLVGWAIGGIVVMSIIPSKRVDRILPVLPPLCLLLAAQFGSAVARRRKAACRANGYWRIATATLLAALVYAGGYGALKVFTGYRRHRDALVRFADSVRDRAVEMHWRYEVVDADDEGLLLYLDKLHFIRPVKASQEWAAGEIDALVAPVDKRDSMALFSPNEQSRPALTSTPAPGRGQYVLIVR